MKTSKITKFAETLGYVMGEQTVWILMQGELPLEYDEDTIVEDYGNLSDSAIVGHYVHTIGQSDSLSDEDLNNVQGAFLEGFRRGARDCLTFVEG